MPSGVDMEIPHLQGVMFCFENSKLWINFRSFRNQIKEMMPEPYFSNLLTTHLIKKN